tara:strand:- start:825 stop:1088 length:264 start_codon:yes stop_codon:yes gene_type:complete
MTIDDKIQSDAKRIEQILELARTFENRKNWADPEDFETLLRNGATPSMENLLQVSEDYAHQASYQGFTFVTVTAEKIDYDSFIGETQ